MFFSFFLDKKRNKKVKAVRCGRFFRSKISYYELPLGRVFYLKGLRLETLLRAMRGFMEALNFSLHVFRYLVLAFSEK
jgi:hypothetical protein